MQLIYDQWRDRKANLQKIENPSWVEVEQAIQRLDGKVHTEVVLEDSGSLSVGGGAGQYLVSMFRKERSLILADMSRPADQFTGLVSGGQKVRVPSRHVVDLERALCAVHAFFGGQAGASDITWIRQ